MIEVTAEMIERGRGGDPRLAAERRRLAMKVREAREKLTSAGSGHRTFDVELLKLYAERRRATALGLVSLSVAVAGVALQWAPMQAVALWLAVDLAVIAVGVILPSLFLGRSAAGVNVRTWERIFVAMETVQGIAWAASVGLVLVLHAPIVSAS